jgi:hypothetical protein
MVVRSVNYFGHVAVASWSSASPGMALGAMLPDFSSMSGARIASTADPEVAAGIELHHKTDAAFHTLPVVTGLMRELDAILARGDCARGPRRAVAHIGVELLLDGVLVDDPAYRESYTRGLAHDAPISWRADGDDELFGKLLARLRTYGVPDDLRRPEAITHRLSRMLAHRPLLAPSVSDLSAIGAALVEFQPRIVVATETVMRAMKAALAWQLE